MCSSVRPQDTVSRGLDGSGTATAHCIVLGKWKVKRQKQIILGPYMTGMTQHYCAQHYCVPALVEG